SPYTSLFDTPVPKHAAANACRDRHRSNAASHETTLLARSVLPKPLVIYECYDCFCCRIDAGRDAGHCLGSRIITSHIDLLNESPKRSGARPAPGYPGLSRHTASPRGPYISWLADLACWWRLIFCKYWSHRNFIEEVTR